MLQRIYIFFLSLALSVHCSSAVFSTGKFISLNESPLRDCCFDSLEKAAEKAIENEKLVMATVYQDSDVIITDLFTGKEERLLSKLSQFFVFYTLKVSPGLMPICSEKAVLLEKMKVSKLPTIVIVNPKTFAMQSIIERSKGESFTESLLRNSLEEVLKKTAP